MVTQETGRNELILTDQRIVHNADERHVDHVIGRGAATCAGDIPYRHRNIDRLELIQCVAHGRAVRHARPSADPIPQGEVLIRGVVGIAVGRSVARLRQASDQGRLTRGAGPGQPAEVSRLRSVPDVGEQGPDGCACN